MNVAKLTCPKCSGEMVRGFIPESNAPPYSVTLWLEGEPKQGFWPGVKVLGEKATPMTAFRCSGCGYIELYASPEFGPK